MNVTDHNAIWETMRGAVAGGTGWWVFSSLIGTMPPPQPGERWYGWLYSFLQRVGANHSLLAQSPEKPLVIEK